MGERAGTMPKEDRRAIHEATLSVMAKTGIRIHSERARKDLQNAGALVDPKGAVVRFPREVVESLLRTVPKTVLLAGRTEEFDLPVDGTHCYFSTDGCGFAVWEPDKASRRDSVLEDVRRTAILADYLPYVSMYTPMVVPHDVPERAHVAYGVKTAFENTQKHVWSESTSSPEEARAEVAMAALLVGSPEELRKRHVLSAIICTVSPLVLDGGATDAALVFAEHHVPVHVMSMAHMGVSAPITLAGDLVVNHAETLAAICAIQAHEPGAPSLYGSALSGMDPRTAAYLGGSPECDLLCTSTVDLAQYCGIPHSEGGFGSSARVPGVQASLENTFATLMVAQEGAEIIGGLGCPDGSTLLSYEQFLVDHEIAGMVLRVLRGVDVDADTLAVDVISKVGPGGGYLSQMHTLRHVREVYRPMLWDADPYDAWVAKGRKDPMDTAREKVASILKEHEPAPLDGATRRGFDRIAKEAARKAA